MKRTAFVGACVLAAACSNGREARLRGALSQQHISLGDSAAIAEQSVAGSTAVEAWLLVDGDPTFAVDTVANRQAHDVRLGFSDGMILSSIARGERRPPCRGIPLAEAIDIAEAEKRGEAVAVQPDDDDACNREVQVLAGDTLWEVKVGPDGTVLETEVSDDDD